MKASTSARSDLGSGHFDHSSGKSATENPTRADRQAGGFGGRLLWEPKRIRLDTADL